MSMSLTLRNAFNVLWRLSLLALPWQTRWILVPGSINGFQWEQGTMSLYGSQILLLLTIAVGAVLFREEWKRAGKGVGSREWGVAVAISLFVITGLFTSNWIATSIWFAQVLVLIAFVWTLMHAKVGFMPIARWFVIAVIPHAGLGIYQFITQYVWGSSLFGIAEQDPTVSGVSVVEHGLYRLMRAYGGFPHPNILGGWLALALTLLPGLVQRAYGKLEKIAYVFAGALFVSALVFTFSRGAWVAAVVGVTLAIVCAWKRASERLDKQGVALVAVVIIGMAAWGVVTQWDHVIARFDTSNRLEQWSVEQRGTSIEEGIKASRVRPLAGWGVGAGLAGISTVRDEELREITPEPPHTLPIVILLESGVVGLVAILYLIWIMVKHIGVRRQLSVHVPVLLAISAIALTDHYLWTLWPGQVLMANIIALLLLERSRKSQY